MLLGSVVSVGSVGFVGSVRSVGSVGQVGKTAFYPHVRPSDARMRHQHKDCGS